MRRREFIAGLGSAAAWPVVARAQQSIPVVGFLNAGIAGPSARSVAKFVQGLREGGYEEGRTVAIDYRWADGIYQRLPQLAADLVARRVSVIATFGSPAAHAAKAVAAHTIPIVFTNGSDPVAEGFVASLGRPGGNITGITSIAAAMVPKRLELLRSVVRPGTAVAILINPDNQLSIAERTAAEAAASAAHQQLHIVTARNETEIDAALAALAGLQAGALIITTDTFFYNQSVRLAALAMRHSVPAIAVLREFAEAGGLMSYGTNIPETFRLSGMYVARILKGEKPADLPVLQPTNFEFVINLKTAKAFGIELHPQLIATADEVIE